MENSHPAFLAGELVLIRSADVLREIYEQFARETEWVLNPISLFPENMMAFAGKRLQISAVSFYHLGMVLYTLRENESSAAIPGEWPERALVDPDLERADESPLFQVASQFYRITRTDEHIEIRDGAGRLYCALRKCNLASDSEDISRVASLRCAVSFSLRYNFDGIGCEQPVDDAEPGEPSDAGEGPDHPTRT